MIKSAPATPWFSFVAARAPFHRVARKGLSAVTIKIAGAVLALGLQIALARALGPLGYGKYAYAFGWLQILLVFGEGGFSTAALRYVAEYRASGEFGLLRGFLTRAKQFAFFESVAVALFAIVVASVLGDRASDPLLLNFAIACATLPLFSQFVLHSTIIRGYGEAILSLLVGLAHPGLMLLGVIVLIGPMQMELSSAEALMLNLGVALCTLTFVAVMQRQAEGRIRFARRATPAEFRTREWLATSTQMMFATGMIYLHARTGVVATGILLNAEAAGNYALVERVADVACLGLTAVNLLVGPSFAALYSQGRHLDLQRYARLAAIGSTGMMLVTAVPLACFGKQLLGVFGQEFVAGYPALLVLLIAVSVSAMSGSAVLLLNMTGHHRFNTLVAICGLMVNLSLSCLLVPRYGILGTAMANALAVICWSITLMLYSRWRLGIWTNVGRPASCEMF